MSEKNSTYEINRGVNSTVEFNGIQGKFLYYVVGVLFGSFILFIILNAVVGSSMIAILLAGGIGAWGWVKVTSISKENGIYGLDKKMVQGKASKVYQVTSRRVFYDLKAKE
jgi:hypothetical protein